MLILPLGHFNIYFEDSEARDIVLLTPERQTGGENSRLYGKARNGVFLICGVTGYGHRVMT